MLLSTMKGNTAASVAAVDTLEDLKALILRDDWSPAIFKNNYRNNENFESTSLMVLDIDENVTIAQALEIFAPYKFLLATTRHHQKEKHGLICDRFRVILFLSKEVKDCDTFTATWFALQKDFPFIDEQCKDPGRFFYKCTDAFIHLNPNGKLVDPVAAAPKEPSKPKFKTISTGGVKGKLSKMTQDFFFQGAEPGTWNNRLFKAAKDAAEQGYDEEWVTTRAFLIMEECRDDFESKRAESEKTISSAFSKEPKYEPRGVDEMPDVRDKIMKSQLFIANHDAMITRLYDPELGKLHDISHDVIRMRLGTGKGGEYPAFASTNIRYANFLYEPHNNKVTFTDKDGMACFNEFQPPEWRREEFYFGKPVEPSPTIPDIYFDFFMHFVGGDERSLMYLVDWIANSLQRRNYTILCAIGNQGIGKGILGDILSELHGPANYVKVRDQVFKSQFNGQLANRTLVHVDEADLNTKEAIDRVKDVVNGRIEIERKGENARSLNNHASFYLSSNSLDAVKIEPGDRRFSIIELTEEQLKDTPLAKYIKEGGPEYRAYLWPENIMALARYLRFKTVSHNMLTPFVSARTEKVREAGLNDWEQWLVFDWAPGEVGKTFTLDQVQEKLQNRTGTRAPGRMKIESLCRKYPKVLRFNKDGGDRTITILGAP